MSNLEFDLYDDGKRLFKEHTLQRTDPYGLWIILDAKGRQIKGIDGSFTNPHDAAKALTNYIDNLPKDKKKA